MSSPVASPLQLTVYRALGQLCFNRIDVVAVPDLPAGAPVLYLGLHRNGAIDGIPYLQAAPGVAFLVSAQLHRSPLGRLFFQGIAVARCKDRRRGIVADNNAGIERCVDHLCSGGKLFVMPEGTSSLGPRHLPFKPGAARIAHEVLQRDATLYVVPLAVYYECAWEWQSRVEVVFGEVLVLSRSSGSASSVAQIQRRFTEGLERVGINVDSPAQLRFIETLAYGATLGSGLSYAACLKRFEDGVPDELRVGADVLFAAADRSWALKHQGIPLTPIGSPLPYLLLWVVLAPVVLAALLANLPALLAGYVAGRTLADDRNVIAFWRVLVGVPALLLWGGVVAFTLCVGAGSGALVAYLVLSAAGLKLYYRVRKLGVALFNSLFTAQLKAPLLAFREQLLWALGHA